MRVSDTEPLLNVKDVAARFGVPVSWIYGKAEDGTLGHLQNPRRDL